MVRNGFSGHCAWPTTSYKMNTACMHTLDLSWNRLGDYGAKALSQWLPTAAGLSKLNISHNGIREAGCAVLLSAIGQARLCRSGIGVFVLSELVLDGNFIGSCGCLQLLKLMELVPAEQLAVSAASCNLRSHDPSVMDPEELELVRWGVPKPEPVDAPIEGEESDAAPVPGQMILHLDDQYDLLCLKQLLALAARIGGELTEVWHQPTLDDRKFKLPKSNDIFAVESSENTCKEKVPSVCKTDWVPEKGILKFVLVVPDPLVELENVRKEMAEALTGEEAEEGESVRDAVRVGKAQIAIVTVQERSQRMAAGPFQIVEGKVAVARQEAELAAELEAPADANAPPASAFTTISPEERADMLALLLEMTDDDACGSPKVPHETVASLLEMSDEDAASALTAMPAESRAATLNYLKVSDSKAFERMSHSTSLFIEAERLAAETAQFLGEVGEGEPSCSEARDADSVAKHDTTNEEVSSPTEAHLLSVSLPTTSNDTEVQATVHATVLAEGIDTENQIQTLIHRDKRIRESTMERLDGVRKMREGVALEMLMERPPLMWIASYDFNSDLNQAKDEV